MHKCVPPKTPGKMKLFKKECLKLAGIKNRKAVKMIWDQHMWSDINNAIYFRDECNMLFTLHSDRKKWSVLQRLILDERNFPENVRGFLMQYQKELPIMDRHLFG